MTEREQAFVEAYCGEARWNAAEAARLAGYANAKQEGWRLKQRADVRAEIDARLNALALSGTDILSHWTEIAEASLSDFYVVESAEGQRASLRLDLIGAARLGKLHLVRQIKETPFGTQILLYDRMLALDRLARARGLLSDLPDKREREIVDAIINSLPDEFRESVRERARGLLAGGDE